MNNHLAIPVKDLEESKKFYQKLGFEVFNSWEKKNQELTALWMKNKDGFKIELVYHPKNKDLDFPAIMEVWHLGLEVENLEENLKELQKEDIEIAAPITKGVSVKRFAFIKDPNGFPIELVEY